MTSDLRSVLESTLAEAPIVHRGARGIQPLFRPEVERVDALASNDGWELLGTGIGSGGQTTLTFAWPAREPAYGPLPTTEEPA